MAFSPDGKTVASGSGREMCLFDLEGRRTKRLRPAGAFNFDRLAFSPDGKRLACGCTVIEQRRSRKVVQIWELPAGRKAQQVMVDELLWLGWSADGEPLAVVLAKGAVVFRELAAGKEQRLEAENLPATAFKLACAYAPKAKVLAVPDQRGGIHVWDVSTGKKRCTIRPGGWHRHGLALSPDGKTLASLSWDANGESTVRLWDVATGKLTRTLAADQKQFHTVAFSPDGQTLATVGWSHIRFWDVATGKESGRSWEGIPVAPNVAFSPDGRTLATSTGNSPAVHLWDVPTAALKSAPAGHTDRSWATDFSPDGRQVVTASADGTVFVWNLATGESLTKIRRREWARSCVFSSDGRSLISCWTDEPLIFSDAATGRELHTVQLADPDRPDHRQSGLAMLLSDDRQMLVAFSRGWPKGQEGAAPAPGILVTGWDAVTRKQLFQRVRADDPFGFAVSPDLQVLAVSQGEDHPGLGPGWKPIRLESLRTGEHLLSLPDVKGQTTPLDFAPDGRLLVTNTFVFVRSDRADERPGQSHDTLRFWDLEAGGEVLAFPSVGNARVAFTRDGRLLALSASLREILLWDLRRGKELRRIRGFDADLTSLTFSPDSKRLVSGLSDSTLLVWDVAGITPAKPTPLDAAGAARAWADLAGEPRKAFAARGALADAPEQAVALLKERLKSVRPADPRELQRLIAGLDSDTFAGREKARLALEALGDRASEELQEALKHKPSLEAHRRLQALLARLRPPVADPEMLRALRAVAVLEDIGTPQARKILETLAAGAAGARLTREAKAALRRLARP
jgi:WD40 repeat protein